jgi:hypothetical protein
VIAASLLACAGLGACASTGTQCQKDISDCIARCESASGPARAPAIDEHHPQQGMSECEKRCGCRPRPAKNAPAPKPTPTGT